MGSFYEKRKLLREFSGSTASKLTINSSINNTTENLGRKNQNGNNSDSSENENEEMSIEVS